TRIVKSEWNSVGLFCRTRNVPQCRSPVVPNLPICPRECCGDDSCFVKQQWGEAEKSFNTAVRQYPKYAVAWFALGRLYQQLDRSADAVNAYRHVIEADPKIDAVYQELAQIAAQRGEWKDVSGYTSQLFKLNKDVRAEFYFY